MKIIPLGLTLGLLLTTMSACQSTPTPYTTGHLSFSFQLPQASSQFQLKAIPSQTTHFEIEITQATGLKQSRKVTFSKGKTEQDTQINGLAAGETQVSITAFEKTTPLASADITVQIKANETTQATLELKELDKTQPTAEPKASSGASTEPSASPVATAQPSAQPSSTPSPTPSTSATPAQQSRLEILSLHLAGRGLKIFGENAEDILTLTDPKVIQFKPGNTTYNLDLNSQVGFAVVRVAYNGSIEPKARFQITNIDDPEASINNRTFPSVFLTPLKLKNTFGALVLLNKQDGTIQRLEKAGRYRIRIEIEVPEENLKTATEYLVNVS